MSSNKTSNDDTETVETNFDSEETGFVLNKEIVSLNIDEKRQEADVLLFHYLSLMAMGGTSVSEFLALKDTYLTSDIDSTLKSNI